ncbi:MAG: hypothetical protein ACOX4W_06350 [Bacilli bacterium]
MLKYKWLIIIGVILTFVLEIFFYIYVLRESILDNIIISSLLGILNLVFACGYIINLFIKKETVFSYQLLSVILFIFIMGVLISFKIYYLIFKKFDFFLITSLILDLGIVVNPFRLILTKNLQLHD